MPSLTDDEEVTGISYERMDLILLALEEGWRLSDIVKILGIEEDEVIYIKNMMQKSEHMRKIFIPKNY
ncbi:hypothetical protein ES705_06456 [subsurface metagenome]